jgi:hypothetical protein
MDFAEFLSTVTSGVDMSEAKMVNSLNYGTKKWARFFTGNGRNLLENN